jgi:hypothetical protein
LADVVVDAGMAHSSEEALTLVVPGFAQHDLLPERPFENRTFKSAVAGFAETVTASFLEKAADYISSSRKRDAI